MRYFESGKIAMRSLAGILRRAWAAGSGRCSNTGHLVLLASSREQLSGTWVTGGRSFSHCFRPEAVILFLISPVIANSASPRGFVSPAPFTQKLHTCSVVVNAWKNAKLLLLFA